MLESHSKQGLSGNEGNSLTMAASNSSEKLQSLRFPGGATRSVTENEDRNAVSQNENRNTVEASQFCLAGMSDKIFHRAFSC